MEWKEPHSTQIRKKPEVNDREVVLRVLHSCCPTSSIKRIVGEVPPTETHAPNYMYQLLLWSDAFLLLRPKRQDWGL